MTIGYRMDKLIRRNIGGRRVLVWFILANVVYVVMLAVTIPRVMSFASGMKLLDMMPTGYDVVYANQLLTELGEEGRQAYLYTQLPLDMIYPLLFGISYCLVLAYFLNRLHRLKRPWTYLCLLPLMAVLFDYLENAGIINLLIQFPNVSEGMARATNVFTILKSASTTAYFLVLLVTIIAFGVQLARRKLLTEA